jgi:membrane protein YfhO
MTERRRDALALLLLALLPVLAHAPGWWEGRLLGPGDGAALHFPLRAAVWEAYRHGDLPGWNGGIFLGTPLLASYRPGALHPLMLLGAALRPFAAYQLLVLASLSAAAVAVFLYVRRLGAETVGAYVAGLSFALGPYLVGHLGDGATVVAAPTLPLLLLALESYLTSATPGRAVGLVGALFLLLVSGSPEAVRAGGALLAGRLLVAAWQRPRPRLSWRWLAAALGAAVLLAAPQLVPTVLAAREAGRPLTGLAAAVTPVPGATGLVLRYASHTPAPGLALAALPLAAALLPVRVLGAALLISLALQWGRGPLAAPGALSLVFDLTLCVLAGLSLSAQWRSRREPQGRRLRAYFLAGGLASAAALSVAAAALGPLPQTLAGAVGVLALAQILYFANASHPDPVRAGVWLLPLTVSFLLQPAGRQIWAEAPTERELARGTVTREALSGLMGARRTDRALSLVMGWPHAEAGDLAYANWSAFAGRRSANGYDPMVPLRTRLALGSMGAGGSLPPGFFDTDPRRLDLLGVRWVQVPESALRDASTAPLRLPVEPGRPRLFPFPIGPATEVRLSSSLGEAVGLPQDEAVAFVHVHLVSGRVLTFPLRAGRETAEWAYDRADVRAQVQHRRPQVAESWAVDGTFEGHHYAASLPLPGRFQVDAVRVEAREDRGRFQLARLALFDAITHRLTPVSRPAAYVSDGGLFHEAAATPTVRLFELPGLGAARVVERLRMVADDEEARRALGFPPGLPFDPGREAVLTAADAATLTLPPGSASSRAEIARAAGGQLEVRAQGPGLLVVAEAWDPGWRAEVDGRPAPLLRVNYAELGVVLGPGTHRVGLAFTPPGLGTGVALALLGLLAVAAVALRHQFDPGKAGVLASLFRRTPTMEP